MPISPPWQHWQRPIKRFFFITAFGLLSEDVVTGARSTCLRWKLDWSQPSREPYSSMLTWYQELIALRQAWPELTDPRLDRIRVDYDEQARWLVARRGRLHIAVNLGRDPAKLPLPPDAIVITASRAGITPPTMPPGSFAVFGAGNHSSLVDRSNFAYRYPGGRGRQPSQRE